ncbi:MAG TPA: hypothetical protein VMG61_06670 [Usitatibacter sp.]|nr:hypothetical protein [Usitatibacter sp.]
MKAFIAILGLAMLAGCAAPAAKPGPETISSVYDQWLESGKPIADTEWRKSDRGLGGILLLVKDANAFMRAWKAPPAWNVPAVRSAGEFRRGDTVNVVVLFSGCGRMSLECGASVAFKVTRPDGSLYGETMPLTAWSRAAVKPGTVAISDASLGIRIEPKDAPGEYVVVATLADSDSGRAVELTRRFRVVE